MRGKRKKFWYFFSFYTCCSQIALLGSGIKAVESAVHIWRPQHRDKWICNCLGSPWISFLWMAEWYNLWIAWHRYQKYSSLAQGNLCSGNNFKCFKFCTSANDTKCFLVIIKVCYCKPLLVSYSSTTNDLWTLPYSVFFYIFLYVFKTRAHSNIFKI